MNYQDKLNAYERGQLHVLTPSDIKFFDFISENEQFLDDYMAVVREVVMKGKKRFRSQLILGKLRYELAVRYEDDAPYGLDDHYARPMAALVRDLGLVPNGFFQFRQSGKVEREEKTKNAGKWL